MTVSLDTSALFSRTDTSDPYSPGNVTLSASTRAVVVFVTDVTGVTLSTLGVTLGGQSLRRLMNFQDNAGEPARTTCWGLFDGEGDTVPTGTSALSVDFDSASTDDVDVVVTSWLGSAPIKIVDFGGWGSDAANPRYTLQTHGMTCMGVSFLWTGTAAPVSPASSTNLQSRDLGQLAWSVDRQTTASSSAFDFNYTAASDDALLVCLNMTDDTWNAPTQGFYRKLATANNPSATNTSVTTIRGSNVGDHTLVVAVANNARTFTSCTVQNDTLNNPDVSITVSTNHTIAVWMVENTLGLAAGDTITVTCTVSADVSFEAYSYTGLDTSGASPFDQSGTVANATAQTGLTTSSTPTTSQADELLIGIAGVGNRFEVTFAVDNASGTWTQRGQAQAGQTSQRSFRTFDRIVAATGAYNFSGTIGSSQVNTGIIATYKLPAVAASKPLPPKIYPQILPQ